MRKIFCPHTKGKAMNILTDKLPQGIFINSVYYPVFTDFKRWLKIDMLLSDRKMSEKERLSRILALCYRELPENIDDAIAGVYEFYTCFKTQKTENRRKAGAKVFSFAEDAELIYAAFFTQYGIDLTKSGLHWFQFNALFKGLTDEHKLSKVISLRSLNLADIKDASKRKHLYELKKHYALFDNRTEEEKSEDIAKNMASLF